MRHYISKKPIGSSITNNKTKSNKFKVISILLLTSIILIAASPFFTGSGLSNAKTFAPYSNGVFPQAIDTDLDATYRVAFPNLTFFYPIAFKTVPNQNKIVLGQLNGVIYWFDNDEATMNKNLMLDLSSEVGLVSDGGFLGMTIHPDFDATINPKNYLYIYYATKNALGQDSPPFGGYTNQGCSYGDNEYQGNYLILERFEVDPITMAFVNNSRTILLKNRMHGTTHYGGGLDFGDDGFLYLTTGDMASWRRSQDIADDFAGGVLRLDVDKDPTKSHPPVRIKPNDTGHTGEISGLEYWIPNDNPFSDTTPGSTTNLYGQPDLTTQNPNDVYAPGDFFEEYFAVGLRNPFRMTKDSQTGTFYIGDVGLNNREEINTLDANSNFGWPQFEGTLAGPGCYSDLFNSMSHEEPLVDFGHEIVNSITGGYVYRGTGIPELYGKYICADFGGGDEMFSVDISSGDYDQIGSFLPEDIISFGEDYDKELFILRLGFATNIYKLIDDDIDYGPPPQTLSQTGIFSNLSTLEVIDGYVPYELYESFWSDGALKKRWIAVPNNDGVHSGVNEQINYSEYGDWEFPPGTVIVKHFDLQVDDNNPSITKKIETRISVVDETGEMYFLTYNWNENETDAMLQASSLDEPVDIAAVGGGTRTQTWHFPSNSDCINCHNHANKGGLGLKSRYLNTDYTYDETGITANQLVTLSHLGIIDESITDLDTPNIFTNKSLQDPNASIDEKARSYMDLNCAYCHRRDNSIRTNFDLRVFNNLEATELLTSGILTPLGIDPNEEIVFAGDASKSILYHRMNSVDISVMMPPISKKLIDQPAVDLVEQWINQLDPISTDTINNPNPLINLALLPSASLSGSVAQGAGRGTPLDILYDPTSSNYKVISQFGEYGVNYQENLGPVDADNGFFWRTDWSSPKFINYITFGGTYQNQPQPATHWRVSYLREGVWITIEEGVGGWVDTGIYEWNGTNERPLFAEAVRVQLYTSGSQDLISIHLRGRGGETQFSGNSDLNTEPKASMVQFKPFINPTTIDNISVGQQTSCNFVDNTYTQELTVSYTNPPATGSLLVNDQSFPITASPQTIILTALDSDSNGVEVIAEFTDGYDTLYRTNGALFTAPADCRDLIIGIDEHVIVDDNYTLDSNASIEILEGGSLTVNGDLTINGQITLNSISSKYSSLIVNGISTGTIKYKRHVNLFDGIAANDLISSPLSNEAFGSFATNNPNIFENPSNTQQKLFGPFNETTGNFEVYSTAVNSATNLTLGKGFRAARDGSEDGTYGTTFTFTGGIETNNVTANITTSGSSYDGWNLIGNPYSSYIDFDMFFALNQNELDIGSNNAVYGYDGDSSNGWTILNNATGGLLIAPGQGFFIKSKSGGGTLTFTPDMRTSGNTDDFIPGRSSSPHQGYLKLLANSGNSNYSTEFYFNDNASLGLDIGYDAAFFNGYIPDFSIYSHLVESNDDTAFTVQSLRGNDINNVIIPLGLHASQGQQITISISETDIPSSIKIYLEDNLTNTFTLLNTNTYSFIASSDLIGTGRFYLRFENESLSITETILDDLSIYTNANEKTIIIKGELQNNTDIILFNINGREVHKDQLKDSTNIHSINVEHLSAGIYIIKLLNADNQTRIEKLILK